jgi:hypothetical protein
MRTAPERACVVEGGRDGGGNGRALPGALAARLRLPPAADGRPRARGGARPGDVLPSDACVPRWRGGSAAAWLLAIARNSLADEARRGRRLAPLPEDLVAEADPEQAIDLETALARLSPSHRRLLELVYFDGYSHAEVAAMTGTTPGAVKTAVWRARRSFESVYREKERHEGPHT